MRIPKKTSNKSQSCVVQELGDEDLGFLCARRLHEVVGEKGSLKGPLRGYNEGVMLNFWMLALFVDLGHQG